MNKAFTLILILTLLPIRSFYATPDQVYVTSAGGGARIVDSVNRKKNPKPPKTWGSANPLHLIKVVS